MQRTLQVSISRGSYPPNRRNRGSTRGGIATFVIAATLLFLLVISAVMASMVTVGAAAAASFYHSFTEDLPAISDMDNREIFKTTRILDRNGDLLYEMFDQSGGKRTPIHL